MSDQSEMTPMTSAADGPAYDDINDPFWEPNPVKVSDERARIAARLRSQPWVNALPIADAIEKDEWDV